MGGPSGLINSGLMKQKKLTVSQLNNYISGVFKDEYMLHGITVEGEITEFSETAGRTYLTLKEGESTISCVGFSRLEKMPVGTCVEATGSVSFYAKTARISFVITSLSACGEGRQQLELLKLKAKLAGEGLFENRPRLPRDVTKIAVITSETGAVISDIISVVSVKNPSVSIAVFDVRVQGESAPAEIAEAINLINRQPCGADVLIVARGGGSAADLQAYNSEAVARAVAASRLPVISAVGHETDYTLCDLCASARAGTPSIAAEMAVSSLKTGIENILAVLCGMYEALLYKFSVNESRIKYDSLRLIGKTELLLQQRRDYIHSLCRAALTKLENKTQLTSEKFAGLTSALDRLSPLKILGMGYAKVLHGSTEVVSAFKLAAGDEVEIVFSDGKNSAKIL